MTDLRKQILAEARHQIAEDGPEQTDAAEEAERAALLNRIDAVLAASPKDEDYDQ